MSYTCNSHDMSCHGMLWNIAQCGMTQQCCTACFVLFSPSPQKILGAFLIGAFLIGGTPLGGLQEIDRGRHWGDASGLIVLLGISKGG